MKFINFITLCFSTIIRRKKGKQQQNTNTPNSLNDNYLYDFHDYLSQYNNNVVQAINNIPTQGNAIQDVILGGFESNTHNLTAPEKIRIKPIDVLKELETIPTPFTLALIDEKISILKDKEKLINQTYAKREVKALLERLENRKKYLDHKTFFDSFQNTTEEKIDILLKKYDLVMKTSDIFIPEFPDIAIEIMKKYTEICEKICSKKPVFYVIAEPDKFRQAYKKRDPILLVESPFGFYYQILGAWDKEMLLLSEL